MPAIVPAVAAELANGARDALRQGAAVLTGNQGNYIASGEPESVYGKVQQATARQACRRYADEPSKFTGAAAVLVENACRPYLDDIGYGQPPQLELPFRGGQCPGVGYDAEFTWTSDQGVRQSSTFDFPGGGLIGTYIGERQFNFTYPIGVERRLSGGVVTRLNVTSVADPGGGNPAIENVRRQDGQPDECGNPVPEVRGPIPPLIPGPRRERFNPGPGIDVDIDVEINPDLTIEVDFGTGPITIDPFGDEPGGGGGGSGGPPPGDVGNPGDTESTGPGGEAEGEAPEGTVLTGLRINFDTPLPGGNEYAPGVYRGVAYIYMGTPDGLDHDPAGSMMRSGQFVHAEKDNLTRWAVYANNQYILRVTPYYRPVEAEE